LNLFALLLKRAGFQYSTGNHPLLEPCRYDGAEDEVYHIQTLNNYVSRWRGWMQKFTGLGRITWKTIWHGFASTTKSPTVQNPGYQAGWK